MPLCACAVARVLWESCPVACSPSCGRLHRQTVKPLPPPTCVVSSFTYCLVGRTMAPSQLEAAPTHKRKRLVFTLPKVRRRTLSVPYSTPCTPPLHSCFTSKQRSFGSLHWSSPTRNRVGLLQRLFLPKVKHYLRAGSANLEILHQANRRGFLSFRVGGNFLVIKNVLEMFVKNVPAAGPQDLKLGFGSHCVPRTLCSNLWSYRCSSGTRLAD